MRYMSALVIELRHGMQSEPQPILGATAEKLEFSN